MLNIGLEGSFLKNDKGIQDLSDRASTNTYFLIYLFIHPISTSCMFYFSERIFSIVPECMQILCIALDLAQLLAHSRTLQSINEAVVS